MEIEDYGKDTLTIRQGRIDLSFHQVVGEVFAHVLSDPRLFLNVSKTSPSVKIEAFSAPHADAFAALKDHKTDILIGWFDGSHRTYVEPFHDEVLILGDARQEGVAHTPAIYSPYCIWGVPSYVPEAIVPDVPSLADPSVAARFKADEESRKTRTLQGITPGAGISRFSKEMIQAYDLDSQGWQFKTGTQEDCFGKVEGSAKKKEWFVVPLWHPQYLHATHNLRALAEPKGLLGPVDEARLVLSKEFLSKLGNDKRDALLKVASRVTLGNDAVTLMDKYVNVDKLSYHNAAQRWISDNQARVDSWFESGHVDIIQRATEYSAYATDSEDLQARGRVWAIPNMAPSTIGLYETFSVSRAGLIQTSCQLPWELDQNLPAGSATKMAFIGTVSNSGGTTATMSEELAHQAMRICALNVLAQLRDAAKGDLGRIQILRLEGYVATAEAEVDPRIVPRILDSASRLIKYALGPKQGAHARVVVITKANALNVPVMLSAVAELRW